MPFAPASNPDLAAQYMYAGISMAGQGISKGLAGALEAYFKKIKEKQYYNPPPPKPPPPLIPPATGGGGDGSSAGTWGGAGYNNQTGVPGGDYQQGYGQDAAGYAGIGDILGGAYA